MKAQGLKVFAGISTLLIAMSSMPSTSAARDVAFDLRDGRTYVQYRDDGYYRRPERRGDDRYERRRDYAPGCPIRSALVIGGRHLRNPYIASVTRRYIIVEGVGGRDERNRVVIQNDMSCKRVG